MLKASDISLDRFLPLFANTGVPVAFLVPTPTGYEKSIMDATIPVRQLLLSAKLHNYSIQGQGPENKAIINAYFVRSSSLDKTSASLYRPVTKQGDPRIWFSNLKRYCSPYNLLALIIINREIYVFNLSDVSVAESLQQQGFAYSILQEAAYQNNAIADELLKKIQAIHDKGFIPSITPGDPGVGDTLENALGISRNNAQTPDYKGIELKASRLTRSGKKRGNTRVNLFAKVPEFGMTYREIVEAYGKWTYIPSKNEDRLAIDNTTFASHPNSHGLILNVNEDRDLLSICYMDENSNKKYLSSWQIAHLRDQLLTKHRETFWVKAESIEKDGIEWFRYDQIVHTKNPNDSLFAPLVATDIIMVDLAGYFSKQNNMKWRDHGMLFKIWPKDLPLLFGEPVEYNL